MKNTQSTNFRDSEGTVKKKSSKLFLLLCSTVFFLFILPLVDGSLFLYLNLLFVIIIIALATFALGDKRIVFLIAMGCVIAIEIVTSLADLRILNHISRFITVIFFMYVVSRMIAEILKTKTVSGRTILEAINGYLLLGIAFSGLIGFIFAVDPDAFAPVFQSVSDIRYFTFVSMTTLGFGDIVPVAQAAKSIVLIVTISGQFYVGVIVAILVGKYASQ